MHRLTCALATAAILVPGSVLAAGCGSDDVEKVAGVDVAQAAQKTAAKGTARMTMRMEASGMGLPAPLKLDATGVMALTEPRGRLSMDLAPVLQSLGVPALADAKLEMLIDGARLDIKVPELPGLPSLPDGKTWVGLDLKQLATAAGLDAEGLGGLFAIDPASQLRALKATKSLKKVGTEKIAGATTTHFRGTFRLSDLVAGLPAAQRKAARDAIAELEKLGAKDGADLGLDTPQPADLWLDDEGVTRRMRTTTKIPGQQGAPAGTLRQSYDLSDFGAKLDMTRPAAKDTYEATEALEGLLKSGLGGAALGGTTQAG